MIRLSRNEIEQLCLKAARGAGQSWGMAEEAGWAAVWLALRGVDGPSALCARLALGALAAPTIPWANQVQPQCPIALGTALCDHASLAQTSLLAGPQDLGPVATPSLLLPFIGSMARMKGQPIEIRIYDQGIILTRSGEIHTHLRPKDVAPLLATATNVQIATADPSDLAASIPRELCHIPLMTIEALGTLAMRTAVPASEASRAGAGASGGDDD